MYTNSREEEKEGEGEKEGEEEEKEERRSSEDAALRNEEELGNAWKRGAAAVGSIGKVSGGREETENGGTDREKGINSGDGGFVRGCVASDSRVLAFYTIV